MGTISRITTFSTGDTLTASDLNGEFDNIISTANGSINADNLGVTAGQASASKAIVLDANKDFANVTTSNQIRNLTISGSLKIGTTFLPDAAGGADLGSTSLEWGDVYVADDKYLYMGSDQNIKIGYDETTTDSLAISAIEGAGLAITLRADEGDDAGDEWKLNVADGGVVTFGNDIASAGTFVTHLTLTPHATVASSTLALAGGLTVAGATQANSTVTVGVDDQGYDVKLFGDTASAYLMWDTSADKLLTAGGATIDIVKDKLLIGGVAVTTTAAELNLLDTASAGTVVASKAVVVDSNKDIASFRNVTLTGELDAATGDFSGDVDVDGTLEADAITLGGTALGSLYSPIAGSSSIVTVGTVGTGTWQGTAVALAYGGTGLVGATDGKIVIADGSGAPVLLDVGSSTAITVLGTVATGTWQGTAVASAYLDADTAHLSTTQTFSGAKTFSAAAQFSNTVTVGVDDTGYDVKFFGATSGSSLLWDESADDLIFTNAGLAVGSDATGDIYYRNSSGFLARLGASTDGYVLTTGGTGTIPAWEEAAGGGHTIQEEGSNLTQRTNLNFVGAGVTATDDSGNNATKVTVTPTGASLPVTRSDGSTSDPIALTSAALGESLVSDTSPQLGGNLDVNGQSIVSDASNENIPITPHGTGSVVVSKIDVAAGEIDGTAIGANSASTGAFTTLDATGDISGSTVNADGDTSAGDNAAMGYTAAEGLILTGQGSTSDVTIKNDADATVLSIPTGTTNVGIGTTAAIQPLHVATSSGANVLFQLNADSGENTYAARRSRGSAGSPTAIQTDDTILALGAEGYDGSTYAGRAQLKVLAAENWSGSARGTKFAFYGATAGQGGLDSDPWVTMKNGNVGIGTTSPDHNFEVEAAGNTLNTFMGNFKTTVGTYNLQVEGTHGGVTGTVLNNYQNSSSPADGDFAGAWNVDYKDDGGNRVQIGSSGWFVTDVSAGTRDSYFYCRVYNNNSAVAGTLSSSGVWTDSSAAAQKEYYGTRQEVWPDGILGSLKTLNVSKYKPANQPEDKAVTETHVSPTAEDFWDAFQIGQDPRREVLNAEGEQILNPSIAPKDLSGVALVAVQELLERVEAAEAKIAVLESA